MGRLGVEPTVNEALVLIEGGSGIGTVVEDIDVFDIGVICIAFDGIEIDVDDVEFDVNDVEFDVNDVEFDVDEFVFDVIVVEVDEFLGEGSPRSASSSSSSSNSRTSSSSSSSTRGDAGSDVVFVGEGGS